MRAEAEQKLTLLNETLEERVAERSAAAEQRARELARSEQALRQQTSILQSILNSMGDAVIVADASANHPSFQSRRRPLDSRRTGHGRPGGSRAPANLFCRRS